MQILYCSTLCSTNIVEYLSNKTGHVISGSTVQKFHRLILKGLSSNGLSIKALSCLPVVGKVNGHRIINIPADCEDNIQYNYLPTYNIPVLRHLMYLFNSIIYIYKWQKANKAESPVIICDVLNISICIGALLSKILGIKVIGIMTDMPGLMVDNTSSLRHKFIRNINLRILKKIDGYIFLTEAMNNVINTWNRPYIIMEGLVDVGMESRSHSSILEKNIIYAGGLNERYGVRTLLDAFLRIGNPCLRLSLYGNGPMASELLEYEKKDSRIKYYGMRSNYEIVNAELKATLLVNPRPTHEEFTKYSFPSKNMEYMVSGTPLLTTALPGMPKEYYPYVFICHDETVDGFVNSLNYILSKTDDELMQFGARAKDFVLNNKNNIIQGLRIKNLAIECLNRAK